MQKNIKALLGTLQVGEEKSLSRQYLCSVLGIDDRTLREWIYEARCAGHNILSNSQNRGYFLPDEGAKGYMQTNQFLGEQGNRIESITKSMRGAQDYMMQYWVKAEGG